MCSDSRLYFVSIFQNISVSVSLNENMSISVSISVNEYNTGSNTNSCYFWARLTNEGPVRKKIWGPHTSNNEPQLPHGKDYHIGTAVAQCTTFTE